MKQDRNEIIPSLINSRGMELAVIKVGGFGLGGITNEVTYFLASSGKWRHLTSIPHVEQCNFGTAVLDNELYVVGGCFNQSLQVRLTCLHILIRFHVVGSCGLPNRRIDFPGKYPSVRIPVLPPGK